MFQAPDLNLIVEFIFMFYKEKPIDWLLDHILWVKVCNPEKDAVCNVITLMQGLKFSMATMDFCHLNSREARYEIIADPKGKNMKVEGYEYCKPSGRTTL